MTDDNRAGEQPLTADQAKELAGTRYGRWLILLSIFLAGLTVMLQYTETFIFDNALVTPAYRQLKFGALAVAMLSGALGVALKTTRDERMHKGLVGVAIAFVVVAGALTIFIFLTQETPDLSAGGTVSGPIEDGRSVSHIFATEPGDEVTLVFTELDGLQATVLATHKQGDQEIVFPDPAERSTDLVKVSKVVTGGIWEVVITPQDDSSGRYRLSYEVERRARLLNKGAEAALTDYVARSGENGYFLSPADEDVLIHVHPLDAAFSPAAVLFADTKAIPLTQTENGDVRMAVQVEAGRSYVLVIRGRDTAGRYVVTIDVPTSQDEVVTEQPEDRESTIPEVYGLPAAEAEEALAAVGFPANTVLVCSGSVEPQRVRRAYVIADDGSKLMVAEAPDTVVDTGSVQAGSTIHLEVSTGVPCDAPTAEARYDAVVLESGPVAYWPLAVEGTPSPVDLVTGEETLAAFTDETATPIDGWATSDSDTGISGMVLDSSSADRIGTDFNPFDSLPASWTIEAWVMTDASGKSTVIGGFSDVGGSSNDARWYLSLNRGEVCSGVGSEGQKCFQPTVRDGQWHHLAVTYDSETGVVTTFTDGVVTGSYVPDQATPIDARLAIGAMWAERVSRWDEHWDGGVSRVAVYDRALSSIEVADHLGAVSAR